jgi:hypothetical protein
MPRLSVSMRSKRSGSAGMYISRSGPHSSRKRRWPAVPPSVPVTRTTRIRRLRTIRAGWCGRRRTTWTARRTSRIRMMRTILTRAARVRRTRMAPCSHSFLSSVNGDGGFGGANGWRLPTLAELQTTMLDYTCTGAGGGATYVCITPPVSRVVRIKWQFDRAGRYQTFRPLKHCRSVLDPVTTRKYGAPKRVNLAKRIKQANRATANNSLMPPFLKWRDNQAVA